MDQFPLDKLVEQTGSRYAVVVAAAERAKQIKDGSPPLVEITSQNPLTIALAEIAQGKVVILEADALQDDASVSRDEYFVGVRGGESAVDLPEVVADEDDEEDEEEDDDEDD